MKLIILISVIILALVPVSNASGWTLEIFGNANLDDTIDEEDIRYVGGILAGSNNSTDFADANHDGLVDGKDIEQIRSIINGEEKELTLLDTAGRVVTVKKPLKTLVGSNIAVMKSLGLDIKDMVIGRYNQVDVQAFPELSDELLDVGSGWSPDIEKILKLNPDVVFLYPPGFTYDTKPTLQSLESSGMTVLCFKLQTPQIHREEVTKLGYIFNKRDEAERYLDWYEGVIDDVKETAKSIPDEKKVKVYFESYKPYTSYPQYGYINESGGIDIFAGRPGGEVDPEAVVNADPDVILKVAYPGGGYEKDAENNSDIMALRDEILSRPELANVTAVKNGRVYIITSYLLTYLPHCNNLECFQIAYQAKWFYPDLFPKLDPDAILEGYLTEFQGWNFDLNKNGVFVYPPLGEN
ncbi:MAG: Periplasmic binding protein [Methanosaeta sp. PtaU1.Bin112]|nr:MAG: Periplasmic binding protein [Methanosaeta sp. PtaU1.Bin112]